MKYFKYSTGTRNEGEAGSWKLYHRDNFTAHSAWNAHVKSHAHWFWVHNWNYTAQRETKKSWWGASKQINKKSSGKLKILWTCDESKSGKTIKLVLK